jgi:hypothetical protein
MPTGFSGVGDGEACLWTLAFDPETYKSAAERQ